MDHSAVSIHVLQDLERRYDEPIPPAVRWSALAGGRERAVRGQAAAWLKVLLRLGADVRAEVAAGRRLLSAEQAIADERLKRLCARLAAERLATSLWWPAFLGM
ncbi:MAG: hypothetical protein FD149_187 [Rhodospirillaceae bacterium]|nr:MAG: hypothetical protein FD149_187 [Rhodospirillaceae bacterium]